MPEHDGEFGTPTEGELTALSILCEDRLPHDTWGRATDPDMVRWNRSESGVLNANVAARLVRRGLAEYERCGCCGASLGVAITAKGVGVVDRA